MNIVTDHMKEQLRSGRRSAWEPIELGERRTSVGIRRLPPTRLVTVGLVTVGLVTVVLAVAGCGDADRAGSAPGSPVGTATSESAPPATRLEAPATGTGDAPPLTVVDADQVDEPCPAAVPVVIDATESSIVIDETSRLEPMLGVVLRYGSEHPDAFGGYGLHWIGPGNASVFAAFTGDLAEHRAALAELVGYPDELIVCQVPVSEAERNAIQATLIDELDGRFTTIGSAGARGVLEVDLNPTEAGLAAELVARYGTAIEVRVGALAYPLDEAVAVCGPTSEPDLVDGLDVALIHPTMPPTISPAGTVALTVRLTNTGDQPIRFATGLPSTVVTDSHGAPRTSDTRGSIDVGIEIALEPGAHDDLPVDVSLASCDPSDGYVLPSGEHFVVVSFDTSELGGQMSSEPLAVTIVG